MKSLDYSNILHKIKAPRLQQARGQISLLLFWNNLAGGQQNWFGSRSVSHHQSQSKMSSLPSRMPFEIAEQTLAKHPTKLLAH